MPSPWALVLVVLGVLGGACALPAPAPLAYTQALAQAIDSYNQRPDGVELSGLRSLNFTMMETDCAASARLNPDDCDFKENGVRRRRSGRRGGTRGVPGAPPGDTGCPPQAIKECSGPVLLLENSPEIDLRCSDVSSDPVLIQRGRFGRFLGRIRRFRPRIKFNIHARGSVG
ncbi:CTHL2 protein, partial [Sapayoa aenigma]|nr:CTHL2 protein [Sapayoa aenigma]